VGVALLNKALTTVKEITIYSSFGVFYLLVVCLTTVLVHQRIYLQGQINGFIGPRHFSSLGPFGYLRSIVGTTVYSRLSKLMEAEGMHI
jgi:hypothetical protein